MHGKAIRLVKIAGIPIKINWTWFLIFALLSFTLANAYFPGQVKDLSIWQYWVMGVVATILLFVSILLHELGHSLLAKRADIKVRSITLFIFGGVSEMTEEPPNPGAEMKMAVAGPAVSVLIAAITFGIGRLFTVEPNSSLAVTAVKVVVDYLALINILLFCFNMVPAFPLDGGRLLRAVIWSATNNLRKATQVTSSIGSTFGILLVSFGLFNLLLNQKVSIGDVWLILIGLFLRSAARSGYQQLMVRRLMEGVAVSEVMSHEVLSVTAGISLDELVNEFFLKHNYGSYPVMEDDEIVGMVSIREVKSVNRDKWHDTLVSEVMDRDCVRMSISPSDDAVHALSIMAEHGRGRLIALDERGQLVGIVTRRDIMELLRIKADLTPRI